MALDDVEAAMAVVEAADAAQAEAGQLPPRTPPSDAQLEASRVGHARFVQRDGPGAWVAVSEGQVVGVAESVRRESFWGLSMLFVHPEFQSRGVGGRLLEAAVGYAAGATQRMIQSSSDPRAMRRYFLAGLAMHPTAEMGGQPDRRAIPPSLPGRDGDEGDLELVAEVEAQLGRSRTEDVAFGLSDGHLPH
jgi:GNAT superfamily N-acetyltransferase